jgi:signal transduction histidine kinase
MFYEITAALNATLNYEKVLDTALDVSAKAMTKPGNSTSPLFSAVWLFEEDQLVLRTSRRFTRADEQLHFKGDRGLIGRTINQGEAGMTNDIAEDPELRRLIALQGCKSAYCIPLRSGIDVYGVVLFAAEKAEFFTHQSRELLSFITSQAMIALQNARLYRDLESEKNRIAESQEEERKKLARDLHDGPTQSVAAIAMRVNFTRRLMERSPKDAAEELYQIEELARKTTKEIRHMLFTLRPLVLESQGFVAALEQMAEKMKETYDQNVLIDVDEEILGMIDETKKGVGFFIVEEAVNNARKHAEAEHIWVRLKYANADIAMLQIQDDGKGFDIEAVSSSYESRGSLGMINLQERSELINGILQMKSAPGEGTNIQVYIPLTEEAMERIRHR